jgi:SAM-dependent methyltransferase
MLSDKDRWNRKHADRRHETPPSEPLLALSSSIDRGLCLDLACGSGANALALAEGGWRVEAVDISIEALLRLREKAITAKVWSRIRCAVVDLDEWSVPRSRYDMVACCYYLPDARMASEIQRSLAPGGRLFVEHFNRDYLKSHPTFNPLYVMTATQSRELFGMMAWEEFSPAAGVAGDRIQLIAGPQP